MAKKKEQDKKRNVEKQNIEKKQERHVLVIYKTPEEQIASSLVPFDGEYNEDMSYKENMENMAMGAYVDGGVWINSGTIVPFHRIRYFKAHKETPDAPKAKKIRRTQRRGRNIPRKKSSPSNQDS